MKRLLVVGREIPRLVCVPWEELSDQNLLDYQGILFACSQGWQIAEQLGLARQLYTFMSSGHTVFVILPRPSEIAQSPRLELNFVPYLRLSFDLSKGKTLNLSTPIRIFAQYREALTGHEFVMRPEVQTGSGWVWKAGITDNVSRPVCAVYGNAYLFHPVSRSADSRGLRAILEEFKSDYEEPEPQPSPQWAEGIAVDIPGFIEADREIAESMEQIRAMEQRIGHSRIKKESLAKWVELLWLDGIPQTESLTRSSCSEFRMSRKISPGILKICRATVSVSPCFSRLPALLVRSELTRVDNYSIGWPNAKIQ